MAEVREICGPITGCSLYQVITSHSSWGADRLGKSLLFDEKGIPEGSAECIRMPFATVHLLPITVADEVE